MSSEEQTIILDPEHVLLHVVSKKGTEVRFILRGFRYDKTNKKRTQAIAEEVENIFQTEWNSTGVITKIKVIAIS